MKKLIGIFLHKKLGLELAKPKILFGKGNSFRVLQCRDGIVAALDYIGAIHVFDMSSDRVIGKTNLGERILSFTILSKIAIECVVYDSDSRVVKIHTISISPNKLEKTLSSYGAVDKSTQPFKIFTLNENSFIFNNDDGFIMFDKSIYHSQRLQIHSRLVGADWNRLRIHKVDEDRSWLICSLTKISDDNSDSKVEILIWNISKRTNHWRDQITHHIPYPYKEKKVNRTPYILDLVGETLIFDDSNGNILFYSLVKRRIERTIENLGIDIKKFTRMIFVNDLLIMNATPSDVILINSRNENKKKVERVHERFVHSIEIVESSNFMTGENMEQNSFIVTCGFDSKVYIWKMVFEYDGDIQTRRNSFFCDDFCKKCRMNLMKCSFLGSLGRYVISFPNLFCRIE